MLEKKTLSLEEIEAQTALELPDREMMQLNVGGGLVNVQIGNLQVGPVNVDVNIRNVDLAAAANVCANVITNNSVVNCDAAANA